MTAGTSPLRGATWTLVILSYMTSSDKRAVKGKRSSRGQFLCSPLWTCGGHVSNGGVHGNVSRSTYYNHRSQALKTRRGAEFENRCSITANFESKRKEREVIDKNNGKYVPDTLLKTIGKAVLIDGVPSKYFSMRLTNFCLF